MQITEAMLGLKIQPKGLNWTVRLHSTPPPCPDRSGWGCPLATFL